MKRTRFTLAITLASLAFAGHANASVPPATHYAFDVAATATGTTHDCEVSIISAPFALEWSRPGEPCSYKLSRRFAGWLEFPAACRLFMGAMLGTDFDRVPATCERHSLFLDNHPDYLGRRYR
jgi:putative copper export protein